MKSIQTKITIVITVIMLLSTGAYMLTAMLRNKASLENDSNEILLSLANYYANVMDDNFRSTEQSVGSIYNYALKRAETYTAFLEDEAERDHYTNDISELGKSIAENTRGAMASTLGTIRRITVPPAVSGIRSNWMTVPGNPPCPQI